MRFDGRIEFEVLRLFGPPDTAPTGPYVCPSVPVGTRSLALETTWNLLSFTAGASTVVLAAAALSMQVEKRRTP